LLACNLRRHPSVPNMFLKSDILDAKKRLALKKKTKTQYRVKWG
jgi:hypothetical protein